MMRSVVSALLVAIAGAIFLGVKSMEAAPAGTMTIAPSASETSSPIPPTLFGMHVHMRPMQPQPWPNAAFGSFRFADSVVGWDKMNPAEGKYDWKWFDKEMADLKVHKVEDVLFTFHSTPTWASSGPNHTCAHGRLASMAMGNKINASLGTCDAPNDLRRAASGSDQNMTSL